MLSSKLFSLLTLAAAAVAQNIPSGEYFISHVSSPRVLEVENRSVKAGAFIVLADLTGDEGQIWSYSNRSGTFKNKVSNLTIEVPRTRGEVNYGTRLVQAKRRKSKNDDFIQKWGYDDLNHLYSVARWSACISANRSDVYAIVESCDDSGILARQNWKFIEV